MTKNERTAGVLSLLCVIAFAAISALVFSVLHIKTSLNSTDGDSQYSEQLQCVHDNKKLLASLHRDSTLPSQERLLRIQYTKTKIARCREALPQYLRYKDIEQEPGLQPKMQHTL